jgi:hypothetical protein
MGKRSYRSALMPNTGPVYPRLTEVNRRTLADWGLLAAGALWLGSAGCKDADKRTEPLHPPPGVPVQESVPPAGHPDAQDGQGPPTAPKRTPGEAPVERLAPAPPPASKGGDRRAAKTNPTRKPKPARLNGGPVAPRLLEAPDSKK